MILEEALKLVQEREASYGNACETFSAVAVAFQSITGLEGFRAQHVALVQILLKLVRMQHSPENQDHATDCCGYLELIARINCK